MMHPDSPITTNNFLRLLLATLSRVRSHLPGSVDYVWTQKDLDELSSIEASKARIGMDIDNITQIANEYFDE